MKYKLSKQVDYSPEWNANKELPEDEQVKFVLKVLSMGDVLELMDVLEDASDDEGNVDGDTLTASTTKQLVGEATRLLPIYATMENLEGEDGEEITVATITEYPQFIGLITEVLFELISISTPNEADSGNSSRPSTRAFTMTPESGLPLWSVTAPLTVTAGATTSSASRLARSFSNGV